MRIEDYSTDRHEIEISQVTQGEKNEENVNSLEKGRGSDEN